MDTPKTVKKRLLITLAKESTIDIILAPQTSIETLPGDISCTDIYSL